MIQNSLFATIANNSRLVLTYFVSFAARTR